MDEPAWEKLNLTETKLVSDIDLNYIKSMYSEY